MTDAAIRQALYRGEMNSEKAMAEIKATLLEIEEAVGKYAHELATSDKHFNDAHLFTEDELFHFSGCWKESWENLYQTFKAGEGQAKFEAFEKCAQFTEFNYSKGYSIKKLLELHIEIEERREQARITTAREAIKQKIDNRKFLLDYEITQLWNRDKLSAEEGLKEAEASEAAIQDLLFQSVPRDIWNDEDLLYSKKTIDYYGTEELVIQYVNLFQIIVQLKIEIEKKQKAKTPTPYSKLPEISAWKMSNPQTEHMTNKEFCKKYTTSDGKEIKPNSLKTAKSGQGQYKEGGQEIKRKWDEEKRKQELKDANK